MSSIFEKALSHAMLYEVGAFWKEDHPAVANGLINTVDNRRAVGYVNIPADRGGETKFGIAQSANPTVNVNKLTYAQAKDIYMKKYWNLAKCDLLPARVAFLHFDGAVNIGPSKASKILQQAVGFTGKAVDGIIGPNTITAVKKMGEIATCNAICNLREQYYNDIVKNNPGQKVFLKGWLRRISEVREFTVNPKNIF